MLRTCRRCKQAKPLTAFGKDRSRKDGLRYWCSECRSTRHQELIDERPAVAPELARCSKCKAEKDAAEFPKARGSRNGLSAWCRACHAVHRSKNKEARVAYGRKYRLENGALCKSLTAGWLARNPGYHARKTKRYRAEKPHVQAALNANYRAAQKRATPSWVDKKAVATFYEQAGRLTKETGIPHHVDHIYPLQSDIMCGLHVEANLQVLPAKLNISKSNRIADAMEQPLCCAWPDLQSINLASVLVQ